MKKPSTIINVSNLINTLSITSEKTELKELENTVLTTLIRAMKAGEENKEVIKVKHNGRTLINADSIEELQAKVNLEKALLNEDNHSVTVYFAVVSSFSINQNEANR